MANLGYVDLRRDTSWSLCLSINGDFPEHHLGVNIPNEDEHSQKVASFDAQKASSRVAVLQAGELSNNHMPRHPSISNHVHLHKTSTDYTGIRLTRNTILLSLPSPETAISQVNQSSHWWTICHLRATSNQPYHSSPAPSYAVPICIAVSRRHMIE